MIDLHTHILPQMDDGAASAEESLAMLRAEAADGVEAVALTPHFYPEKESAAVFLQRRDDSYQQLCAAVAALPPEEQRALPRLILGAEVAWSPRLNSLPQLEQLCYEGTRTLLVELPFCRWKDDMLLSLRELSTTLGYLPLLAHPERYRVLQSRSSWHKLLELGLPMQLSCDMFGRTSLRCQWGIRMLRRGTAQVIASDCHGTDERRPDMRPAMQCLERRLDPAVLGRLHSNARLLLEK